ncbi:MAG: histidine phosphatase family protein [Bdellovibrionota bacterium]
MAIKTIVLLRHGQYKNEPSEQLTPLGRKQAILAGKRLKDMKFNKFYFSTLPRARETAEIVKKTMGYRKKLYGSDFLHECVPGFPKKMRKKYGYTDEKKLMKHKRQADRAYRDIFTFSKSNRFELVVCHGNIIRYFLCKALGVDTELWQRLDIKQCGITVIQLNSKKRSISIISHNDIGHIPLKMQTFI